jgi:hypothetical protein
MHIFSKDCVAGANRLGRYNYLITGVIFNKPGGLGRFFASLMAVIPEARA